MPLWKSRKVNVGCMRTILFVDDDLTIINRLKVIMVDQTIQCFFATKGEEALKILSENEIAVAVVDLTMPVLSGKELIEMISGQYPDTVVMLLAERDEAREAIEVHNNLHTNKLIIKPWMSVDELNKWLQDGLETYNSEDKQNRLVDEYRERVEKYKETVFEMTNLLNDRMEGYQEIEKVFKHIVEALIQITDCQLTQDEKHYVSEYEEKLLREFIQIYLVGIAERESFGLALINQYHDPSENRYFMYEDELKDVSGECFQHIRFIMKAITDFYSILYPTFRAKITIQEAKDEQFLINTLYEIPGYKIMEHAEILMKQIMERLIEHYSTRFLFGAKNSIQQYKIYIKKS